MIAGGSQTPGSGTVEMPISQTCRRPPTPGSRTWRPSSSPSGGSVSCSRVHASRAVMRGPRSSSQTRWASWRSTLRIRSRRSSCSRLRTSTPPSPHDARSLAGEAAAQANTWSVITGGYAALNRHELPATTSNRVSMDHRRGGAFAPGELSAYIRAAWENTPNANIYVEVVHRLSSLGAVVTQRARGVSLEGFDAEWRDIAVLTVDGGLISRGEIF